MEDAPAKYPNIKQSIALLIGFGVLVFMTGTVVAATRKLNHPFYTEHRHIISLLVYVVAFSTIIWIAIKKMQALEVPLPVINLKSARPDIIFTGAVAGIGISFLLAILQILLPLPGDHERSPDYNIVSFISLAVAAPVLEELLFRGIILNGLLKQHKPLQAIAFSSFLFGLAHVYPWHIIVAFSWGCMMSWIFYKTQSLATCMVIHSLNNTLAFLYKYRDDAVAFSFDQAGFLQIIITAVVTTLSLLYLVRRFRQINLLL